MKEELCEKMVEIRISDRVMSVVVFEEDVPEVDLWVCSTKWKKKSNLSMMS